MVKICLCYIGFLSLIIPNLSATKIKNHLVIPSEHRRGYITLCFALWEIHRCLFSTVQNQTPQSQPRLSAEEHVHARFISCSVAQPKNCRTNTGCPSFGTRVIWTPIRYRWCYIIASGILVGSLQITIKLG